jgi:hypothetical protein
MMEGEEELLEVKVKGHRKVSIGLWRKKVAVAAALQVAIDCEGSFN